jgi:hypothetical protein
MLLFTVKCVFQIINKLLLCYVFQQFSLPKEQHAVQPGAPAVAAASMLAHQSRSFPGGPQPRLARSPSVSSQGSVDSAVLRQVSNIF